MNQADILQRLNKAQEKLAKAQKEVELWQEVFALYNAPQRKLVEGINP